MSVVDTVADIRDLGNAPPDLLGDPREELRRRLLDPNRSDEDHVVDVRPHQLLVDDRHVAGGADEESALSECRRHGSASG